MTIQRINLNTSLLSLYIENQQGLVFNYAKKKLYSVSSVIIAFIFSIDEGLSESEAICDVSEYFDLSSAQLLSFYQEAKILFSTDNQPVKYIDGQYPELNQLVGYKEFNDKTNTSTYVVGDTSFSITSVNQGFYKDITDLLRPIEKKLSKVHFQISVEKSACSNDFFDIYCNDLIIEERLLLQEVMPLIIDRMQILTFQHSDYHFCFHGAALQTPHALLLLPGVSGAGKSTLSAILAAKHNQLYSDEMIVLDDNFNLQVLSLPIAIKSGSWEVLSEYYPELDELPEFLRIDGRRLKYVWPHSFATNNSIEKPVTEYVILNPAFDKNNQDKCAGEELSVIATISVLIDSGYQVGFELDDNTVEKLLSFIENAKRYRLSYNTSTKAEEEIATILECVNERK